LNTALALVQFVLNAEEQWSFSPVGTHCLENILGLVRRESLGDDRDVVASRIIAKTGLLSSVMHDLGLSITHRGPNNVGGTVLGDSGPEFTEIEAERLFRSLIHVSSLEFYLAGRIDLLSLDGLRRVLSEWSGQDHHANDPTYRADFVAKPSNARIAARIMQ
jgi:hypothetical protein